MAGTVIAIASRALMPLPRKQPAFDEDDYPVGQEAEQPDRHHVSDHNVHAPDVIGIPKHVSETRLHGDHFGDDDGGPGYSDTETKTGEDRWQSTWQNDSQ